MKIYIPEIGDEIKLSEDWSFYLVLEPRNKGLLKIKFPDFLCEKYSFYDWTIQEIWSESKGNILMNEKLAEERRNLVGIVSKMSNEDKIKEFTYFYRSNRQNFVLGNEMPNFIMPKGTILKLARIYIKGKNNEYSSLSFWAKIPGIKNKIRFFAKLKDINNINYEI